MFVRCSWLVLGLSEESRAKGSLCVLMVSSLDNPGDEERNPTTVICSVYIDFARESKGIVCRDVHKRSGQQQWPLLLLLILSRGAERDGPALFVDLERKKFLKDTTIVEGGSLFQRHAYTKKRYL